MKHVTYGEKSLLMSDASADALIGYAAAIGMENSADVITLSAIGMDGNEAEVAFLLNASTAMVVESASGHGSPPENEEVVFYMQERTQRMRQPPPSQPQYLVDEIPDDVSELG